MSAISSFPSLHTNIAHTQPREPTLTIHLWQKIFEYLPPNDLFRNQHTCDGWKRIIHTLVNTSGACAHLCRIHLLDCTPDSDYYQRLQHAGSLLDTLKKRTSIVTSLPCPTKYVKRCIHTEDFYIFLSRSGNLDPSSQLEVWDHTRTQLLLRAPIADELWSYRQPLLKFEEGILYFITGTSPSKQLSEEGFNIFRFALGRSPEQCYALPCIHLLSIQAFVEEDLVHYNILRLEVWRHSLCILYTDGEIDICPLPQGEQGEKEIIYIAPKMKDLTLKPKYFIDSDYRQLSATTTLQGKIPCSTEAHRRHLQCVKDFLILDTSIFNSVIQYWHLPTQAAHHITLPILSFNPAPYIRYTISGSRLFVLVVDKQPTLSGWDLYTQEKILQIDLPPSYDFVNANTLLPMGVIDSVFFLCEAPIAIPPPNPRLIAFNFSTQEELGRWSIPERITAPISSTQDNALFFLSDQNNILLIDLMRELAE